MQILSRLYLFLVTRFPRVEILIRKLYWKNYSKLKRLNPHRGEGGKTTFTGISVEFDDVLKVLSDNGIGKGALLVVHSSYSGLQCTGLSEEQIIDRLLDHIGPTGTLAMPVIRKFKGEPKPQDLLTTNVDDLTCTYNVKSSPVISGMLPYTLMQKENAVVSHFPYNPLCAVGPLAKPMMEHNLDGELPSAHGPNSSWKFCLDHNAYYIGLVKYSVMEKVIGHPSQQAVLQAPILHPNDGK